MPKLNNPVSSSDYSRIFIAVGILAYIAVNLPLFFVLATQSDVEVILAIIGHAPNQFLFLVVFFPFVVFGTLKTYQITLAVVRDLHEPRPCRKKEVYGPLL